VKSGKHINTAAGNLPRPTTALNSDCDYFGITDDTHHALVGYGTHNHIQRFKCQRCRKVFTSRIGTPLFSEFDRRKCSRHRAAVPSQQKSHKSCGEAARCQRYFSRSMSINRTERGQLSGSDGDSEDRRRSLYPSTCVFVSAGRFAPLPAGANARPE
jgi:hypothetical protein